MSISYIIAFVCLFGCKPSETIDLPQPNIEDSASIANNNVNFELISYKRMGIKGACYSTIVTKSNVIYVIQEVGNGHNDALVALNKESLDTIWVLPNQGTTNNHQLYNDILYYESNDRLVAIDVSSGSKLWEYSGLPIYDGLLSDYTFGSGKIYAFFNFGDKWKSSDSAYLFSLDPVTGDAQFEYKLYTTDRNGYRPQMNGMVFWQHPSGNKILFCQSTSWNWSPNVNQSRGDYFAIDLTADSLYLDLGFYWYDRSNVNTQNTGFKPLLDDNNVIFSYREKTASLNLISKKVVWETDIPIGNRTSRTYAVIHDKKLYCDVGNEKSFNVLNISDGSFIFGNKQMGGDFYLSPLRIYDDAVWCSTTTGLYKVDNRAQLKKKLLNEDRVGGYYGSFQYGMDIDEETGFIYTTRGYAYVCIQERE